MGGSDLWVISVTPGTLGRWASHDGDGPRQCQARERWRFQVIAVLPPFGYLRSIEFYFRVHSGSQNFLVECRMSACRCGKAGPCKCSQPEPGNSSRSSCCVCTMSPSRKPAPWQRWCWSPFSMSVMMRHMESW